MSETKKIGQLMASWQRPPSNGSGALELTPFQDSNRRLTLEKYGDFGSFCETFSLKNMQKYCAHPSRCVNGNAPTLASVKHAYGVPSAKLWIKALAADFAANAVNRSDRRMTEEQLDDWADTALTEWGYLTVTEWMLFFQKAKAGKFGSLYNDVNCIRLSEMVNDFVYGPYRQGLKDQFEQQCKEAMREKEEAERRGKTMTAEQFKKTDSYKRIINENNTT